MILVFQQIWPWVLGCALLAWVVTAFALLRPPAGGSADRPQAAADPAVPDDVEIEPMTIRLS